MFCINIHKIKEVGVFTIPAHGNSSIQVEYYEIVYDDKKKVIVSKINRILDRVTHIPVEVDGLKYKTSIHNTAIARIFVDNLNTTIMLQNTLKGKKIMYERIKKT